MKNDEGKIRSDKATRDVNNEEQTKTSYNNCFLQYKSLVFM